MAHEEAGIRDRKKEKTVRTLRRIQVGLTQAFCFVVVCEVAAPRGSTRNKTSADLKTDPFVVSNH
jgi:hypothetical protein